MKTMLCLAATLLCVTSFAACSGDAQAMTPASIEKQYGVSGAFNESVATPDGRMPGTIVPVTLADGSTAQLVIPEKRAREPHAIYLRDRDGIHPVQVRDDVTREQVRQAPVIVQRRAEAPHADKRSWEKEALIIGGTAGAGTLIGAVAGGKKGAAIGATSGGIGGLIYDLATRNQTKR